MTDKDFDRLLKDALTSEDVPESLNESLILLAKSKKNKKAKIFKFVKAASSCAAVFVCAVAVLSYFNSDLFLQKNTATTTEVTTKSQKDEIAVEEEGSLMDTEINSPVKESAPVKGDVSSPESPPVQESEPVKEAMADSLSKAAADAAPTEEKSATAEDVLSDAKPLPENIPPAAELSAAVVSEPYEAASESISDESESTNRNTFSMKRSSFPETLDMLFNEGYDYKALISGRIKAQIVALPYAQDIKFSEIGGNEQFSLNDENSLTIIFSAGTIAPAEHGDLFFTVGTVQNGVLVE